MLGWWFNAKVLRVLTADMGCDPAVPGMQSASFNGSCKIAREFGGNEYDADIMFTCIRLMAIRTSWAEKTQSTLDFIYRMERIMVDVLVPRSLKGISQMLAYADEINRAEAGVG